MPEGPEVRRAADRIERAIVGKPLSNVVLMVPREHISESLFQGAMLQKVHTYGKAFGLEFDNDLVLYVHLQLYGVWKTGPVQSTFRTNRQLRIRLETDTHHATLYSATDISLYNTQTITQHPYIKKLGPDLLNQPTYGVAHLSRYLKKQKFSKRTLGLLLLDQSFVSGVGNYLRSEILFVANLVPQVKLGQLQVQQITALARAIHSMMHRSYKTGGITLESKIVELEKSRGVRRRNRRHFVFARATLPCFLCATPIEKIEVAGRRLYFCSTCQNSEIL